MLDIRITIQGDTGTGKLTPKIGQAIRYGLARIGKGVYNEAFGLLSGASGVYETRTSKKTGKSYRKKVASILPGQYPVPVRTGHLRRMLGFVLPGKTKTKGDLTFVALPYETVIFDAAQYADIIFTGKGTSRRYGPRDAIRDGLNKFNHGNGIENVITEEIQKVLGGVG